MKIPSLRLLVALALAISVCFLLSFVPLITAVPALIFTIAVLFVASRPSLSTRRQALVHAINIADGTWQGGLKPYLADAAFSLRYLLAKSGSDASHVAICGAADFPLGFCLDTPGAAEEDAPLRLLGLGGDTGFAVPSAAFAVDVELYTAAGGKVSALSATAGTYWKVGRSLRAAVTDDVTSGSPVAIVPCYPVKTVVT